MYVLRSAIYDMYDLRLNVSLMIYANYDLRFVVDDLTLLFLWPNVLMEGTSLLCKVQGTSNFVKGVHVRSSANSSVSLSKVRVLGSLY